MNIKKFPARPENLLNLGYTFMVTAQANNLMSAFTLDRNREVFVWGQVVFLLAMIVIFALHIRQRRRDPYPVDLKGARVVFFSFVMLALLSSGGYR